MNAPLSAATEQDPHRRRFSPLREWKALLDLVLGQSRDRTVVRQLRHQGPLRLQRLFWPEGPDWPHAYLLHPPGGLAPGDHLDIAVTVEANAGALLTTPSANRIYRSDAQGHAQTQCTVLKTAPGATLEWLPQETIVFDAARSRQTLSLHCDKDSTAFVWDMQILGRSGSNAPFIRGESRQNLRVFSGDSLCLSERVRITGEGQLPRAKWGLNGKSCYGSWLLHPEQAVSESTRKQWLASVREALGSYTDGATLQWSATEVDGLLVGRALCTDSETLKQFMEAAWQHLRPLYAQREACPPRIWAT